MPSPLPLPSDDLTGKNHHLSPNDDAIYRCRGLNGGKPYRFAGDLLKILHEAPRNDLDSAFRMVASKMIELEVDRKLKPGTAIMTALLLADSLLVLGDRSELAAITRAISQKSGG